jgi:hypothetical protein
MKAIRNLLLAGAVALASALGVYYFNPYTGTYWGRFDLQTKRDSLLAEKDRAGQLKDIPEKAFPAEGPLPQVPDAKDKLTLAEPAEGPLPQVPDAKDKLTLAEPAEGPLPQVPDAKDKLTLAEPIELPAATTDIPTDVPAPVETKPGTDAPPAEAGKNNAPASPAASGSSAGATVTVTVTVAVTARATATAGQ